MIAIQVSYEIGRFNIDREVEGLTAAMIKFNVPKGCIITYNVGEKFNKNISIIPFWKIYEELFSKLAPL